MSSSELHRAKQQYESFLNGKNRERFEAFNSNNSRIDTILAEAPARNEEFNWFWFVCIIIFTLSYGQSQVERGFNVNKEILVENLQEESLKGQRIIYDHIQSENRKLQDFKLTSELFSSCKSAHQSCTIALEEIKLNVTENEKKVKRKIIGDEINDVKKRKLDLETCIEILKKDADKLPFEAEQKNDLTLWIKTNSFWKTATEKAESIRVLDKAIVKLQEEKENMKIWTGFKRILVVLIANLYLVFHQTNAFGVKLNLNRLRLSLLRLCLLLWVLWLYSVFRNNFAIIV